jgi:hypothetical protein
LKEEEELLVCNEYSSSLKEEEEFLVCKFYDTTEGRSKKQGIIRIQFYYIQFYYRGAQ